MGAGPVAGIEVVTELTGQFPGDTRRLEQIGEAQAQPLHLIRLPALQASHVGNVGQGDVTVDLAGTDMEDAGDREPLHARKHARGGHGHFRGDEGDLVADRNAELGGCLVANDDAELAGL